PPPVPTVAPSRRVPLPGIIAGIVALLAVVVIIVTLTASPPPPPEPTPTSEPAPARTIEVRPESAPEPAPEPPAPIVTPEPPPALPAVTPTPEKNKTRPSKPTTSPTSTGVCPSELTGYLENGLPAPAGGGARPDLRVRVAADGKLSYESLGGADDYPAQARARLPRLSDRLQAKHAAALPCSMKLLR
ncbi:MAG TPA: hypothetical protein VGB85_29880, partial [Nannocystis sp.]